MTSSRLALRAWPWAMALAVCAPLLRPGYVLSFDMVWVPHLSATRSDVWGFGSALPRAVPSDAVVAVLNTVVPGQLLQKLMLVLVVGLAGTGTIRLLSAYGTVERLVAATWYVWNPFVAERLVLGQWPLLIGYAAFPWLVDACLGLRSSDRGRWAVIAGCLFATAMSPAGGLMGALLAGCAAGRRRAPRVLLLTLVVNLPWIVAGLGHASSARSDPDAVALFDLQPEAHLGRLGAALTLGGVWNTEVVPESRSLLVATVVSIVLLVLMAYGALRASREHLVLVRVLLVPAVVGLMIALAGWLLTAQVGWLVAHVPAGGLLRDGSRYLAMLAPLEAVLLALGVGALRTGLTSRGVRQAIGVIAIILPLAVMPDLAWGAAGRLRPVSYPTSWTAARTAIQRSDASGDVLVLPFTSYRAPSWNRRRPVLDPAGRFFTRDTVVSDALVVSGHVISGEDPKARRIASILTGRDVVTGLRSEGIGLVVVQKDAGPVGPAAVTVSRLPRVYRSTLIDVYEVG